MPHGNLKCILYFHAELRYINVVINLTMIFQDCTLALRQSRMSKVLLYTTVDTDSN